MCNSQLFIATLEYLSLRTLFTEKVYLVHSFRNSSMRLGGPIVWLLMRATGSNGTAHAKERSHGEPGHQDTRERLGLTRVFMTNAFIKITFFFFKGDE